MNLQELAIGVKACQACPLAMSSTHPVPGLGEAEAKYFILGEAPGATEDKEGIPFIGASGKRLNKLIALAGIDLADCYVTNVCKCRPPDNRDPRKMEIRACLKWLNMELELVKPSTIITLGRIPLSLFSPFGVRVMHGSGFPFEIPEGGLTV